MRRAGASVIDRVDRERRARSRLDYGARRVHLRATKVRGGRVSQLRPIRFDHSSIRIVDVSAPSDHATPITRG